MFVVSEGQPVLFSTNYPIQHPHSVTDFLPMHNRQWKVVTVAVYFSKAVSLSDWFGLGVNYQV